MPEKPEEKRRARILRILQDVEGKAAILENMGHGIVRTARFSRDAASCFCDAVNAIPNDGYLAPGSWDRLEAQWEAWHASASRVAAHLPTEVNPFGAIAGTAAVGSNGELLDDTLASRLPNGSRAAIERADSRFDQVVNGIALIPEVKAAMIRLELDRRRGSSRTPVELLDEAASALACPSAEDSGPVAVLVAVRECVESTLSRLLASRPTQEPARRAHEKILSIGRQCGRATLPSNHFIHLGTEATHLLDALSHAKQEKLSRPQVMDRYNQALLFLQAFLDSLDESQLRQ
jgi:hypothetical protein